MTTLADKFGKHDWSSHAAAYLSSRLPPLEARLQTTFQYVQLHSENRKTFSYEFTSILRDCGSVFASVCDAMLNGGKTAQQRKWNFGHYRCFLLREVPDIGQRTVCLRPCFPAGIVVPFEELQEEKGTPKWWTAHNQVKHHEYDQYRMGNLEHCVTAVSGLVLLGFLMGIFVSDAMFVNIGIAYSPDSVDMSQESRLFPTRQDISAGKGERISQATLPERAATATVVVAASNASSKSKTQADYVCNGTSDEVQIQAGINALPNT